MQFFKTSVSVKNVRIARELLYLHVHQNQEKTSLDVRLQSFKFRPVPFTPPLLLECLDLQEKIRGLNPEQVEQVEQRCKELSSETEQPGD